MSYVLEADLKNYFGSLDHGILLRFLEERVGDPRVISLIRRWLKAGILEKGELTANEQGTPQGGSISCVLSNLYLHHSLDLWFERKFKPQCHGEAHLVRFVDDFVGSFQHGHEAEEFLRQLRERFARFNLTLAEEKTRILQFGRFAAADRAADGVRPETFEFLGYVSSAHMWWIVLGRPPVCRGPLFGAT